MSATSVRIKESVIANLRAQAEQLGVSMQALVDDVLERELSYGPHFALRPLVLPTGLLPLADEAFSAAEANGSVLVLLYHDRTGTLASIAGQVKRVLPTSLELTIWQDGYPILLPRDAIRAWETIEARGKNTLSHVITAAILFQRFGAILHPQVTIPERARHGLL